MSSLTHKADYTEELTEPEREFIEFIFNFSHNYKGSIEKLRNDHWEIIHIDERKEMLEYMDEMCEMDINILNKYMGASTTQEFETRFEDLRLKLMNPISYRIFNTIRDIQLELPINRNYEDIVADDIDGYSEEATLPREDDDDAFWERMVILPFMRSTPPSEIDRNLLDKLLDEKDDIVSLCLQHLHNVIRNNYAFSFCPRSEAMKQSWRRAEFSTASMVSFWSNCIDETADLRDTLYASELHAAYIKYCTDNDLDAVSYMQMLDWISKNTDPERCMKKRIHRTGSNPLSGYAGIKIKSY